MTCACLHQSCLLREPYRITAADLLFTRLAARSGIMPPLSHDSRVTNGHYDGDHFDRKARQTGISGHSPPRQPRCLIAKDISQPSIERIAEHAGISK